MLYPLLFLVWIPLALYGMGAMGWGAIWGLPIWILTYLTISVAALSARPAPNLAAVTLILTLVGAVLLEVCIYGHVHHPSRSRVHMYDGWDRAVAYAQAVHWRGPLAARSLGLIGGYLTIALGIAIHADKLRVRIPAGLIVAGSAVAFLLCTEPVVDMLQTPAPDHPHWTSGGILYRIDTDDPAEHQHACIQYLLFVSSSDSGRAILEAELGERWGEVETMCAADCAQQQKRGWFNPGMMQQLCADVFP